MPVLLDLAGNGRLETVIGYSLYQGREDGLQCATEALDKAIGPQGADGAAIRTAKATDP